jgi:hypothetical protein
MNKFFKTALLAATVFSSTFALGQVINVTPKYPGETTEVNVNPLPPQGGAGQGVASGSNPANPPITSPPPPIRMSTAQAKATKEIRDGYRSRVVYIHTYLRKDTWKAEMDKAHEWVALQFKQRDLNAFHIYQELITVRDRIDVTESDIAILKREAASHGWNVSKTVPLTANPVVATVPTTTTPVTPTLTTIVPTTVASAAPVVPAPVLVTQQLLPPPVAQGQGQENNMIFVTITLALIVLAALIALAVWLAGRRQSAGPEITAISAPLIQLADIDNNVKFTSFVVLPNGGHIKVKSKR